MSNDPFNKGGQGMKGAVAAALVVVVLVLLLFGGLGMQNGANWSADRPPVLGATSSP